MPQGEAGGREKARHSEDNPTPYAKGQPLFSVVLLLILPLGVKFTS